MGLARASWGLFAAAVAVAVAACAPGEVTGPGGAGGREDARVGQAVYVPLRAPVVIGKSSFTPGRGPLPILLNRYGGAYTAGADDAAADRSSVLAALGRDSLAVPGFAGDDAAWAAVVDCVRAKLGPWSVDVVESEPPATAGAYLEVVFGGDGAELGMRGYGGVAPLDPNDCRLVDRAVLFVFSDGLDPGRACEAAVQSIGHAAGLDHAFLCEDAMSYLGGCGEKRFVDADAPCGGYDQQPCVCGRAAQNSARLLDGALGRRDAPPAPAGPACEVAGSDGPGYAGACSAEGVLSWCDGGELRSLDCAAAGLDCAQVDAPSGPGFDCVARAPSDACMGVDYYGQCDGNVLSYCYDGELRTIDCGASGGTCGYQDASVGYDCHYDGGGTGGDACMGVDFYGQCDGDLLSYCLDGQLVTVDCAASGRVCAYESAQIGYNCL